MTKEEYKPIRRRDYKKRYMEKWLKGFIEYNNREPTDFEIKSWNYGFTAGYKARKKRILGQLGQKEVLK